MSERAAQQLTDMGSLSSQLADARETLRAIRAGEVDALLVADGSPGEQVFTLSSADRPYRRFVESMADGAATVSSSGIILYANQSLAAILGLPQSDIVGAPLASFVPERHHHLLAEHHRWSATGGSVEIELGSQDRPPIWARVGASSLEIDGELMVCLTFADLTQNRLDQAALTAAHEQALMALQARSQFVANMSHEIRTPLNGVIGMAALMLTTELTEEQREYADGLHASGTALLSVVNQILDFSKLDSGHLVVEDVPFAPLVVVEDVCTMVASAARAKRLELMSEVVGQLPDLVSGDYHRLRQVLSNLVTNAVKFTPAGSVCTSVSATREAAGWRLRFTVEDTGIGVRPQARARIFDSFAQADDTTTREYGGTGLGLAICRQLIELMGGEIGVDSGPGPGSRFWFTVLVGAVSGQPVDVTPTSLAGRRVLLVDDSALARRIISDQLGRWGLECVPVASGRAALELLSGDTRPRHDGAAKAGQDDWSPFDLLLVDSDMTEMGGIELIETLRPRVSGWRSARGRRVSIVMLLTDQAERAAAIRAGANHFVSKPVRQAELYGKLVAALEPAPAAAPQSGHRQDQGTAAADGSLDSSGSSPEPPDDDSLPVLLLVEDNKLNQLVAARMLQKRGYRVDVAGNGQLALDMHSNQAYAGIFLDCHMPVLDGYQTAAEIRRRETGDQHIPIVAMTANTIAGDREKCLAAGMDDYLGKPISPEALDAALSRTVPPRRQSGVEASTSRPQAVTKAWSAELFDSSRTAELCQGNVELVVDLLTTFADQLEVAMERIEDAHARGDERALLAEAHSLKGSAASVGAMRMSEMTDVLYQTCRSSGLSGTAELLAQVRQTFSLTLPLLPRPRSGAGG